MNIIKQLCKYLQNEIEVESTLPYIEDYVISGTSTAGTKSREEIFTREILCPAILKFFNIEVKSQLNLTDEQIIQGLGTEGYDKIEGFGFTPSKGKKYFFTKGQAIAKEPPQAWFKNSNKNLTAYAPCPDFAIKAPLPMNIIGETKYFTSGSEKSAIKELYNDLKQVMFYLGAFSEYQDALLLVADASPNHTFYSSLSLLKDELLSRFGEETNIHLCVIRLT